MALANNQLLMLSILMYTDCIKDGDSVREIIERMEADLECGKSINSCRMDNSEWHKFLNIVKKQLNLLQYYVTHYKDATGMKVACFIDNFKNPKDVNIVFRGSHTDEEWNDNGMSCFLSDTHHQKEASEYVNGLPEHYGNHMTAAGSSKGGNKAQYVTIVTNRIEKCVSFNGQGFSKAFIDKYSDKISERANRILSISASYDYVNSCLFPIAGRKEYLRMNKENVSVFIELHKPNALLTAKGELTPITKQSRFSKRVSKWSEYIILSIVRSNKNGAVSCVATIFDIIAKGHRALRRLRLDAIWDFIVVMSFCVFIFPIIIPKTFVIGFNLALTYIFLSLKISKANKKRRKERWKNY